MKWVACTSEKDWKQQALSWLYGAIDRQLLLNNPLVIALSGGETPWPVFQQALSDNQAPWDKLRLVPTDERWVDLSSDRSNEGRLRSLFQSTNVEVSGFRSVAESEAESLKFWSSNDAALPRIALLGVGADGHFASIFTQEDYQRTGTVFSTKQASETRLSFSSSTLLEVPEVAFLTRGKNKEKVFKEHIGTVQFFLEQRPDTQIFWME